MYLLRHGEVSYFADPAAPVKPPDVVLTPVGEHQARLAGQALARVQFDRVITSGVRRTIQTAEHVLAELEEKPHCAIESWPDLKEFDAGAPEAIPDAELERAFLEAFTGTPSPDASYLGGETVGSLADRVGAAMERLHADQDWKTILLVLHGGVNRAILSWALAGRGAFFAHFEQSPACINIVDSGRDFIVRGVNLTPYDPVHSGPRSTTLEQMLEQYRDYRRAS